MQGRHKKLFLGSLRASRAIKNVLIKRNRFKFLKRMSMFIHQSVEILNMPKESYAASLRLKAKATDAHQREIRSFI